MSGAYSEQPTEGLQSRTQHFTKTLNQLYILHACHQQTTNLLTLIECMQTKKRNNLTTTSCIQCMHAKNKRQTCLLWQSAREHKNGACSSVGRASEFKSKDPGFDPLAGQFEGQFLSLRVNSEWPVVWSHKNTACTRLGINQARVAQLCRSWLSSGKATQILHAKKSHWDNKLIPKNPKNNNINWQSTKFQPRPTDIISQSSTSSRGFGGIICFIVQGWGRVQSPNTDRQKGNIFEKKWGHHGGPLLWSRFKTSFYFNFICI